MYILITLSICLNLMFDVYRFLSSLNILISLYSSVVKKKLTPEVKKNIYNIFQILTDP